MKIFAIALAKQAPSAEPILLTSAFELSSFGFFQRGGAQEVMTFGIRTLAKRTQPGVRQTVQLQGRYL